MAVRIKKAKTELEAWKLVVRVVKGEIENECDYHPTGPRWHWREAEVSHENDGGLCEILGNMSREIITLRDQKKMEKKIEAYGKTRGIDTGNDLIWSSHSNVARLRWVRKQIAELEPKRRAAKKAVKKK